MADPNFNALLDKQMGSVEKPKPFPEGPYNLLIIKREFGESQQKKTPYVRFEFRVVSPGAGVDQELLAHAKIDFSKRTMREDFYLTDDALFRLTDFLQNALGLPSDLSTRLAVEQAVNRAVIGHVKQEMDKQDPTRIYTRIASFEKIQD